MKYFRNTLVLVSIITALLLSVKSGYAEETYNITSIKAISTQTLEIDLNQNSTVIGDDILSDLSIYKEVLVKKATKDLESLKTVTLKLNDALSMGNSYSILSVSGVEGSIEFSLGDSLKNKPITNNALDGEDQGIKQILILDTSTIEITFLKNLGEVDFDFKIYKDISINTIKVGSETTLFEVILDDVLEDDSDYVGTLTFLEDKKGNKIDIDSGFYDFSTKLLKKYKGGELKTTTPTLKESEKDESSLEASLLNALDNSSELNTSHDSDSLLDGENQMMEELNSAGESLGKIENTQLEDVALGVGTTPDTGAETWVLILLTFIINTFYFFSRRKKLVRA